MSWAEVKKINSDLTETLDIKIDKVKSEVMDVENYIKNVIGGQSQFFTSNGTFTVPKDVTTLYISAIASGGGGGSAGSAAYQYLATGGGGGGGAGYYCIDKKISVTPGEKISISIGGPGTGGISVKTNPSGWSDTTLKGTDGSNAGNLTVGSYLTLTGGTGGKASSGKYNNNDNNISGGAGGTLYGEAGTNGSKSNYGGTGGKGGTNYAIFNGSYGKGGNGGNGVIASSYTLVAGGDGASGTRGAVLITWGNIRYDDIYPMKKQDRGTIGLKRTTASISVSANRKLYIYSVNGTGRIYGVHTIMTIAANTSAWLGVEVDGVTIAKIRAASNSSSLSNQILGLFEKNLLINSSNELMIALQNNTGAYGIFRFYQAYSGYGFALGTDMYGNNTPNNANGVILPDHISFNKSFNIYIETSGTSSSASGQLYLAYDLDV